MSRPELLVTAILFGIWMPAALDGAVFCITIEGKTDLGAKIAMVTNMLTQAAVVTVAWLVGTSDAVWLARLAVDGLMMFVYVVVTLPVPLGRAEADAAPWLPARASGGSPCPPGWPASSARWL